MTAVLSGWGRTAPTSADVARPADVGELSAALAEPPARGVIARGLGRAYGDAAQNAGGAVLDMGGLDRVRSLDLEHGTVVAEAGLSLEHLMQLVVPRGWFVPVTPGTRAVTLGGAFACDIHGKNHHRDGSFARHVEWIELVTPGGDVRRLDPADDAELFHATAGGMGLTGVIAALALRLIPIASPVMTVETQRYPGFGALLEAMRERDERHRYAVSWIDCLSQGRAFGRGIGLWGDHAGDDGQEPPPYAPRARLAVPDIVPAGALSRVTARAFNAVWYRRAPAQLTVGRESLSAYFHPLDGVRDWNRLYGPKGFVQYQFVVPLERDDALREVLQRLTRSGTSSFLGILKRFGPAGDGHLSFPMPGWTLAIDIPAGAPGLPALLDGLDATVCDAGGRVYLAKDARLRRELLERMYPRLGEWRGVVRAIDPDGVMRSDLDRRLGLR